MLTWDESKRAQTLAERGLDFADAEELFAGRHFTSPDERRNYGRAPICFRWPDQGKLHRPGLDAEGKEPTHYLDEVWT